MAYEDDDLTRWLSQQQAPNLEPQQAQPAAADGPWARARALMERQNQMQYTPQEYKLPATEAAPDRGDWKTILAMGLDLLGSKGRNVGNIAMQGEDAYNRRLAEWKKANGPEAQLARQMQVKQLQNMDRASFDRDRAAIGDQIGQEVQMARAEQETARDQRNFEHTQERDMAGDVQHQLDQEQQASQFKAGQDLSNQHFAASQQLTREGMAQSAAQAAAARAQAARFHQDSIDEAINARQDNFAHADKSQQALFDQQAALNAADNQTKKDVYALSHPTPVAPQGYRVKSGLEQQFNQAMGSPKIMSDILTQTGNAKQISETLDELMRLRSAPSSASNKKLYDAAIKTLIGDRSQEGSTGVLSGTEFERYLSDLPEYGAIGNVSSMRGAWDVLHGRDPAMETLGGIKTRYRASNLAKLSPYGIEYDEQPTQQDDPIISRYGGRLK